MKRKLKDVARRNAIELEGQYIAAMNLEVLPDLLPQSISPQQTPICKVPKSEGVFHFPAIAVLRYWHRQHGGAYAALQPQGTRQYLGFSGNHKEHAILCLRTWNCVNQFPSIFLGCCSLHPPTIAPKQFCEVFPGFFVGISSLTILWILPLCIGPQHPSRTTGV